MDTVASIITILAGVGIGVTLVAQYWMPDGGRGVTRREVPIPNEPMAVEGASRLGSEEARVALVEYLDLQCPYSARFARDVLPALRKKYIDTGKVLMLFRHYPLPNHPAAPDAAEAAICADQHGLFLPAQDFLFRSPETLKEAVQQVPTELGLATEPFKTCLAGAAKTRLAEDTAAATALNVSGTPAFFIGSIQRDGRVKVLSTVRGARPLSEFEAALDDALVRTR